MYIHAHISYVFLPKTYLNNFVNASYMKIIFMFINIGYILFYMEKNLEIFQKLMR